MEEKCINSRPRFAGQAKATPSGYGRLFFGLVCPNSAEDAQFEAKCSLFDLARPGAATKIFQKLVEAARCQPSAPSVQLPNKQCDSSRFTELNFFPNYKEVMDKESIRNKCGKRKRRDQLKEWD
jgi:hypothetical protein